LQLNVNDKAVYYNLGEWLHYQTFGILSKEGFQLVQWKAQQILPFNIQSIQKNEI